MSELEENKAAVAAFYDLMFNQCKPAEAIEKYAGNVYIQHNPAVADGKEAFIEYFTLMAKQYPGKRVHFKRIIAEGDYVVLHCFSSGRGIATGPGLTFFVSTKTAKSSNTGTCCRSCPTPANSNTMF